MYARGAFHTSECNGNQIERRRARGLSAGVNTPVNTTQVQVGISRTKNFLPRSPLSPHTLLLTPKEQHHARFRFLSFFPSFFFLPSLAFASLIRVLSARSRLLSSRARSAGLLFSTRRDVPNVTCVDGVHSGVRGSVIHSPGLMHVA